MLQGYKGPQRPTAKTYPSGASRRRRPGQRRSRRGWPGERRRLGERRRRVEWRTGGVDKVYSVGWFDGLFFITVMGFSCVACVGFVDFGDSKYPRPKHVPGSTHKRRSHVPYLEFSFRTGIPHSYHNSTKYRPSILDPVPRPDRSGNFVTMVLATTALGGAP